MVQEDFMEQWVLFVISRYVSKIIIHMQGGTHEFKVLKRAILNV